MRAGQILGRSGQPWLGSVSSAYVNALLDTAASRGADRNRLAERAGIAENRLLDPSWRLGLEGLLRLFDLAREASGDEFIGLHMGMQARPRTFSALGYAAMSCNTLGQAVALIPRYESLVYDGGSTTVTVAGGRVRIAWHSSLRDFERMRPVNEAIVAGWLSFGRWITGIRGAMHRVWFQHSRPAGDAEYKGFFGCPIRFGMEKNALSFDAALMEVPLEQHDDQFRGLMEQQARQQLREIHAGQLSPRVASAIRRSLPGGAATAVEIARALHLSERSLRRYLQEERWTFSDLLAQVRHELALHYLAQPGLSISEITLLLGYGEQSTFTAAFKRWTGSPPGEYRQMDFPGKR